MALIRILFIYLFIQLIPSFTFGQSDAGIVYIDNLKSSYCGDVSRDIYVRVKNFASTKQLDTVSIGWSINGTSQTAKQYIKAIKAGDTSPSFKLGNANFTKGSYIIKVWTYKPNNSVDTNNLNDSNSSVITIYDLPIAGFSFTNRCPDTAISFVDTSTIGSGSITDYKWYFGDGDSSTAKLVSHLYKIAGNYNVKLVVRSNHGCVDSITQKVTVYPLPKIGFISNYGCDDYTKVQFNASGDTGNIQKYFWYLDYSNFPTKFTLQKSPVNTYKSSGKYKIKLDVISKNGCWNSFSKTITFYSKPKSEFTYTAVCEGDSMYFTNNSSITNDTIVGYQWIFPGGDTSDKKNPVYVFAKSGTYTVKLITTSIKGCKDSISKSVEVHDKPKPSFSATNACLQNAISFVNKTVAPVLGTYSYSWNFGDGKTSNSENPNHNYTAAGVYLVTLKAISSLGCLDSVTQFVTVYSLPKADFTYSNDCVDSMLNFVNTSTIADSISSYKWYFGDGKTSTEKDPFKAFSATGIYNVSLIVKTKNGCIDSISKNVQYYTRPTSLFTVNNTCINSIVELVNKSYATNDSIVKYSWDFGDGDTSIVENPKHIYDSIGRYKIVLHATSSFGCTDTFSQFVTIYPLPTAKFNTINICIRDSAHFTESSISAQQYIWDFGDKNISHFKNASHKYTKAGTYDVKLKVINSLGCIDSMSKQIEIFDVPEAIFSAHDICLSETYQFTDAGKGATSWLWKFGDDSYSIDQNPAYKYNSAGKYDVWLIVSNDNGCKDSVMHTITVDSTCVWPGDANADRIVDNKDILAIGIAYADTGFARTDTSTSWKGNLVKNWNNNFSSGANYKHVDSDGDGLVSYTDTNAVTRNYTKTHPKKYNTNRGKSGDPELKIEIQNDSLKAGDELIAYITLGENALPAKDVYGIAFSLNYNTDYFGAVKVDYTGNWLGNNIITYQNSTNALDLALTKTDHKNTTGFGKISTVKMLLKKDLNPEILHQINLEITDNLIISADEEQIPVNIIDDSIQIIKEPNSVNKTAKTLQPEIKIYPNPFKVQTIISYNLWKTANVQMVIFDMSGKEKIVMPSALQNPGNQQFILEANQYNLKSGIYLIKVEIDGLPVYKKIIKLD
ncbi:MAG: PKD domain-containing protein [Sphingobacteriales bacterium]|nr:MAG: PKD domain-containing protein [Sphingobacteriales bacterium]